MTTEATQRRRAACERAQRTRAELIAAGVDLEVPPTTQELVAAGVAVGNGDPAAATSALARQRRRDARESARAAGPVA